jgi:hypothetical protein
MPERPIFAEKSLIREGKDGIFSAPLAVAHSISFSRDVLYVKTNYKFLLQLDMRHPCPEFMLQWQWYRR